MRATDSFRDVRGHDMSSQRGGRDDDREQAHEIRGALNAATVTADLLEHLSRIPPEADPTREARLRKASAAIVRQIRELTRLTENWLDGPGGNSGRDGTACRAP
jgi:hypothetical protein